MSILMSILKYINYDLFIPILYINNITLLLLYIYIYIYIYNLFSVQ